MLFQPSRILIYLRIKSVIILLGISDVTSLKELAVSQESDFPGKVFILCHKYSSLIFDSIKAAVFY